jgi:hypothetical protein
MRLADLLIPVNAERSLTSSANHPIFTGINAHVGMRVTKQSNKSIDIARIAYTF